MVLTLTNSSIPYLDNSLPKPLFLTPPKGTLGSDTTTLFTVTMPACTALEYLSALDKSCVQMLAPRPNFVLFATSIACASSSTVNIGATGPKVSSCDNSISCVKQLKIV